VHETLSVPFTFSFTAHQDGTVYQRTVEGVVRLDDHALVIEHVDVTQHFAPLHVERSDLHRLHVPIQEIAELSLRRPWLAKPRLELRVHSLDALSAYPYAAGARCTLPVARRDRERAQELALQLAHRLADAEIRRLEDDS
jgi:hypothetical protein